ncbi:hypothetical protein KRMM14A1259_00620 [Krasilnikovia sp. MM14-A1259]
MRRHRPVDVRYRVGAANDVLRQALSEVWNRRCHACEEPLLFTETEIDHIIPRTTTPGDLADLITQHGLASDFDLDRPANLAPICRPCNGRKSNRRLLHARSTTTLLDIAKAHAPEVVRRVNSHHTTNTVARDLNRVATANLSDPLTRKTFIENAQPVVQALALLDQDRVADYTTVRHLHLRPDNQYVRVMLNARGRVALSVIEDICGSDLDTALEAGIPTLKALIDQRVADHFRTPHHKANDPRITTSPFVVTVRSLDFSRVGTTIAAQSTGRAIGETHAAITDADPIGRDDPLARQDRYAEIKGDFELIARWDLNTETATPEATVQLLNLDLDEFQVWDGRD